MALSSQSLSKRGCHFGYDGNGNNYNNTPGSGNNKRMCLGISKDFLSYHSVIACYSSSDVNETDLEDEQSCYRADQVRAKRRASTRMSFSVNPNVSRAIAKYSDEDEEHNEDGQRLVDENIDCKLLSTSSNANSSICLAKLKRRTASSSSFHLSDNEQQNNTITNSQTSVNKNECLSPQASGGMKRLVPSSDKNARSRCFDYLVSAIDEAWARYCTATSYTDDEEDAKFNSVTPASIATDEEDYFGNTTDITDYEDSDYGVNHHKHNSNQRVSSGKPQMYQKLLPVKSISVERDVEQSSSQLQALKDRLTKAKYYLQDLVDSEDLCEVGSFWKRWDMIKYATIELVEDDDDDDVVESTIEELEDGRFYLN